MKSIYFKTPTLLSYLDLVSMGGSDKANNDKLLGTYNSGSKFAMALAIRNNIQMTIEVFDSVYSDGFDRNRVTTYIPSVYTEICEQTNKEKELIQLFKNISLESYFSSTCCDYGGGDFDEESIKTGFSTKLGIDWELWMLLREVYSNMVDEDGSYSEDTKPITVFGTLISLQFEENSPFDLIWQNRHLYINEKEPLFEISNSVQALENEEGFLRIYKQNILVYSKKDIPSRYAYNIKFGTIDEKRILSDIYSIESSIISAIEYTSNEEFLKTIISKDFSYPEKEFLSNRTVYGTSSDLIHKLAFEVYEEHGEVKSYPWILDLIKKRKDCKIAGKKIKSIEDSVWSYSETTTVESIPQAFSTPETIEVDDVLLTDPFIYEIKKYYNFNLDVEVKKAKLKGSKVIADKHCNCIIISEDFDLQVDFGEFIIQYIDLTQKGNAIKNLGEYIVSLLRHKF